MALYIRTGTLTSPNEIVPLQIALGMVSQRWSDRWRFGGKPLRSRRGELRSVVSMAETTVKTEGKAATKAATRAATPWGPATLLEELRLPQQSGGKRFASLVQLLEDAKGERLVRFAYATDGVARRGPVTLRVRDLERLRAALDKHPALGEVLRF